MKMILVAVCVCLFVCSLCKAQTEEEIEWVNKHFRSVITEVLPIEEGTNTYVGFRAHRDLHNPLRVFAAAQSELLQPFRWRVSVQGWADSSHLVRISLLALIAKSCGANRGSEEAA